uniref:hypothetical protein n=1 Tax=Promicromonospora sp. CA-289581 TaxID=3240013 RepID=UPI003F49A5B9
MSLTSQLYQGNLTLWCSARLPGTPGVVAQVQAAVAQVQRPVRPAGQVGSDHWADVGGIVDVRLSSFVQLAAPYGALLGAVRLGALAWGTAELEATAWPSHEGTPERLLGLSVRPSPSGWLRLPGGHSKPAPDAVELLLGDFLDRLLQFHAEHAPAGHMGPDGVERQLARACWVVAQLEGAYRGSRADPRLVATLTTPGADVEQLLQLAPEHQVVEVVEILHRLEQAGTLDEMRRLAGKPRGALGYAGPVFVDRWADGDLILTAPPAAGLGRLARRVTGGETGPASTLVDVKTVMRLDDVERVSRWLWQIAGYAALDAERDLWRIRRAGLLLARHGVLITWSVDELVAQLAGVDVGQAPEIRRAFGDAVVQAARSEGATGFPGLV